MRATEPRYERELSTRGRQAISDHNEAAIAMQSQDAVSAYVKNKQILQFGLHDSTAGIS